MGDSEETKPITLENSIEDEATKAWKGSTIEKWGLRLVNSALAAFGIAVLAMVHVPSPPKTSLLRSDSAPECLPG